MKLYTWLDHTTWKSARWKTALHRKALSQPARLGLESNVITPGETFFDFGCGRGSDVEFLVNKGVVASGFDAYYCPHRPLFEASVVQTAFVLNVIETEQERKEVIQLCWGLATKALIIAVQPHAPSKGCVGSRTTKLGTFQVFYTNAELKQLVSDSIRFSSVKVLANGIVAIVK